MDNNLFRYATRELSQDAFICWLLSYAIKGCDKDEALTACAKEFLHFFIPELNDTDVYLSEPPRRQYKSIDVLVTVNDKYKVIIEDKTHTYDHSNQLIRYRNTICDDFPEYKCVGVYYMIGFQSDLSRVHEAEYTLCDRRAILSILKKYPPKTQNNILHDYYEHLNTFDIRANEFKQLSVSMWGFEQISGFYKYCKDTLTYTGLNFNYGYVHNPSGGFFGMWINKPIYFDVDGLKCELYLQCGFSNGELSIHYRASTEKDKIRRSHRNLLTQHEINGEYINFASKHNFKKPKRYGSGKTVALGVYDVSISTCEEAILAIKTAIDDFFALIDDLSKHLKIASDTQ